MNFKPFAIAGLVVILCGGVVAAEQFDDPPEEEIENLDESMPEPTSRRSPAAEESPSTNTLPRRKFNVRATPSRSARESSAANGEQKASLPYSPYPAGLTWVLTPQPFYAQIRHHGLYYPPHTYVRRCPYYPRGYYWGANWRFNVIGRDNLLFLGAMRFNPYLTAKKAQHHKNTRGQKRYDPPPGPIGQAQLLGSMGPSVPMALPPTSVPDQDAPDGDRSGEPAKTTASPRSAAGRPASPRGPARTVSSRRRSKSDGGEVEPERRSREVIATKRSAQGAAHVSANAGRGVQSPVDRTRGE